ncbi:hypothetical protein GE21DRAFT_1134805 [Neurospora crassa]|nr:hypothetical protein GE21DRAFT_1134805 [Neurospora crassa]
MMYTISRDLNEAKNGASGRGQPTPTQPAADPGFTHDSYVHQHFTVNLRTPETPPKVWSSWRRKTKGLLLRKKMYLQNKTRHDDATVRGRMSSLQVKCDNPPCPISDLGIPTTLRM